jgi:hypothetical protein
VWEPLPKAAIEHEARTVRVPAYNYPFLHAKLAAWAAARVPWPRTAEAAATPRPPWPRHWRNWVRTRNAQGLVTIARPEQLDVPERTQPAAAAEQGATRNACAA